MAKSKGAPKKARWSAAKRRTEAAAEGKKKEHYKAISQGRKSRAYLDEPGSASSRFGAGRPPRSGRFGDDAPRRDSRFDSAERGSRPGRLSDSRPSGAGRDGSRSGWSQERPRFRDSSQGRDRFAERSGRGASGGRGWDRDRAEGQDRRSGRDGSWPSGGERSSWQEDRGERGGRSFDRGGRGFDRDDRGGRGRFGRDEQRSGFGGRSERPSGGVGERRFGGKGSDRNERFERGDRGERWERRSDRNERFERSERSERPSRGSWDRNDERTLQGRFQRDERAERRPRFDRDADRGDRRFGSRDDSRAEGQGRFDDARPSKRRWEDSDSRPTRPEREGDRRSHSAPSAKPWRVEREDRRPRAGHDQFREERHSRSHRDRDYRSDSRRFETDESHDTDRAAELDQMSWNPEVEVVEGSDTTAFADYGLPKPLVAALSGKGIINPFPIQAATIPDALAGRDILARAQTGSGKTLGFGLPMLTRLDQSEKINEPRGVIIAPTRELAVQVADELAPLAANLGLRMVLVAGGMSFGPQLKAFRKGVDIVVATPGRLVDLMEQDEADLSRVEMIVLDEADHMADLGFSKSITEIVGTVPQDAQKMLFSATLDDAVSAIVTKYLHNPVTHQLDDSRASVTTMTHVVWQVEPNEKSAIAARLTHRPGRTIVFVRTQMGADRVARTFQEAGVLAAALHGGLTQGQRVRTLNAFKNSTIPVLIATDVAARGIHVDDVSLVLHYDPANNEKDYLHRAGRTARAGKDGLVASLVQPHQRRLVARMLDAAGVDVRPRRIRLDDEELALLTDAHEYTGEPITAATVQELLAPAQQRRAEKKKPYGGGGNRRRRFGR